MANFSEIRTGVFDNLAHIIREFYKIDIKNRTKINLRIPKTKKETKFYKELQSQNIALYNFLSSEQIQTEINAFYPLRDSLQHRELFRGITYEHIPDNRKNLIELSDEVAESLKEVPNTSFDVVDKHFLEPYAFIVWAQKVLITIVNGVLSSINWDSITKALSDDIQSKIQGSHQRFEQGVGKFIHWQDEPWYF